MPPYESILGLKLRYCRKSAGLTQLQTANILKMERSSISYYESGKILPTITYLFSFSKVFHISIDDLADNDFTAKNFSEKYPISHFAPIIEKAMTD